MSPGEAAYLRNSAPKAAPASDENLPEIVVSARKIPWWLYALAGAAVAAVIFKKG